MTKKKVTLWHSERRDKPATPIDIFDQASEETLRKALNLYKKPYPKMVLEVIQFHKPEIEHWYSKLPFDVEPEEYEDELDAHQREGLKVFDEGDYKRLKREWIENCYYPSKVTRFNKDKKRRDLKGRLCQIIISKELEFILPDRSNPPKGYGAKELYELYKTVEV